MNATTVAVDLAKNVFAVHGVDELGKAVREYLAALIAQLPPCRIGIGA